MPRFRRALLLAALALAVSSSWARAQDEPAPGWPSRPPPGSAPVVAPEPRVASDTVPPAWTEPAAPAGGTGYVPARGAVFVPRMGLVLGGDGEWELHCKETGNPQQVSLCSGDGKGSTSTNEKSGPAIAVDLLAHAGRTVRLGASALWSSATKYEQDRTTAKLGSDLTLAGVVEALLPASPTVAFPLRAQLGGTYLFRGSDLATAIDRFRDQCDNKASSGSAYPGTTSSSRCSVNEPLALGIGWGVGVGVVYRMTGMNLRADVLYQRFEVPLYGLDSTYGGGYRVEQDSRLSVTRTWILFGPELGL